MFYWCILNKPSTELVRQVFDAMSEFSASAGWLKLVQDDLKYLNINMPENYIKLMTKYEFRKLVRSQIRLKRFEYLSSLKGIHSKTRNLEIDDSPKAYLSSEILSTSQKQFLFRFGPLQN